MEYLWIFYWLLLMASILLSIGAMVKNHLISGFIQLTLSVVVPIANFVMALSRAWVGTGENEIAFVFRIAFSGGIDGICILIGYGLLIILSIYHGFKLYHDGKGQ